MGLGEQSKEQMTVSSGDRDGTFELDLDGGVGFCPKDKWGPAFQADVRAWTKVWRSEHQSCFQ